MMERPKGNENGTGKRNKRKTHGQDIRAKVRDLARRHEPFKILSGALRLPLWLQRNNCPLEKKADAAMSVQTNPPKPMLISPGAVRDAINSRTN
jgi:hypothetical protein